jgi:hypothetical protein
MDLFVCLVAYWYMEMSLWPLERGLVTWKAYVFIIDLKYSSMSKCDKFIIDLKYSSMSKCDKFIIDLKYSSMSKCESFVTEMYHIITL